MLAFLVAGGVALADSPADIAARNGRLANRALVDSNRVMHAWLERRDPVTGLLPTRGGSDPRAPQNMAWTVSNSAADLYPFMVIAAHFTEPTLYHGALLELLRQETLQTTRSGRLSDDVLPGGKGFAHAQPDMGRIIFGSAEYMKDGLVPLTELLGDTPWYHRMLGMASDLVTHSLYETAHGRLPAQDAEPNGCVLQVLSRLYSKTGDERYLKQVLAIADFYFLELLPANDFLPAHRWDVAARKPRDTRFVLADHGNEIVGGLAEAFLLVKHKRPEKAEAYRATFIRMIDKLLAVGRNPDGVWHHAVDLATHKPIKNRGGVYHPAHCWGYMYTGVYTAYLATGETRFRDAVIQAVDTVAHKPEYLFSDHPPMPLWRANAYSDAIESALLLLNRVPHAEMERQIDLATARMLDVIGPSGIVEDWYGDGNTIRTALMYVMLKTQGARMEPWDRGVHLGAVREGDKVLMTIEAEKAWRGTIHFDHPRHRDHFQLPVNYPRLNEWPEWFTVEHDRRYDVRIGDAPPMARIGAELIAGLAVSVRAGGRVVIEVTLGNPPPYAK